MTTVLTNVSTRPVELHLTAAVVVLPPRGQIDCAAEDLGLGHVRALCENGILRAQTPEPARPARRKSARQPGAGRPSKQS